jgi:glycerol-3-phosphate acyltransferase PlsY
VFHRFKGGKGVATCAGIVFALHWPLGLALSAVWLLIAFGFKISSVAALVAAALMPLGMFYVAGNAPIAWAMVPIALILVWRHKANIQGLSRDASGRSAASVTRRAAIRAPSAAAR